MEDHSQGDDPLAALIMDEFDAGALAALRSHVARFSEVPLGAYFTWKFHLFRRVNRGCRWVDENGQLGAFVVAPAADFLVLLVAPAPE